MNYFILDDEVYIRLLSFLFIFTGMAIWELILPKRELLISKLSRWQCNLAMVIIDSMSLRFLMPFTAMTAASYAAARGWGLLNKVDLPLFPSLILGVTLLDLAIYFQHAIFHAVPLFWRLHKIHHTDLDIDVTTGVRFHPLEVILSMGLKIGVVLLTGASAPAVLLFEVLLNGTSMFNHSNVAIAQRFDKWLRLCIVTPDMHRVHHSVILQETNSNFGFNFPWWDRLFGTYRAQPAAGHTDMIIGMGQYRDPHYLTFLRLLALPFSAKPNFPSHLPAD